jgi:hypothetical protein
MFKKFEIRPSNLVQGTSFSHPRMGIWSDGTSRVTYFGLHTLEDTLNDKYKPIPLTEEWLLKFGFIKTDYDNFKYYHKGLFQIKHGIKSYWYQSGDLPVKIEYVHQLQNIYFYLVGEELTYL